jgi:hypothetical protein
VPAELEALLQRDADLTHFGSTLPAVDQDTVCTGSHTRIAAGPRSAQRW